MKINSIANRTFFLGLLFAQVCSLSLFGATVVVNDNGDASAVSPATSPDTASATVTLRSAIQYLNAHNDPTNAINFSITASPFVIQPGGASSPNSGVQLPSITVPVTIDGYNASGFAQPNTLTYADNAVLAIVIEGPGSAIPSVTTGLTLEVGSNGSLVQGLVINNFLGDGAYTFGSAIIVNSDSCTIAGNFLGTDPSGTVVIPNLAGVILNGNNNSVGTANLSDRNLIAGSLFGVSCFFANTYPVASYNLPFPYNNVGAVYISGNNNAVSNNFLGTDATGQVALQNDVGVRIVGNSNTVGETSNVINAGLYGVQVIGTFGLNTQNPNALVPSYGMENLIIDNIMGSNAEGTQVLPSYGVGVHFCYGPADGITPQNNEVMNNQITGFSKGIQLGTGVPPVLGNTISGNTITDCSFYGIHVSNALDTLIGGTTPEAANVISNNHFFGIYVTDLVSGNVIQGNLIGTDSTGQFKNGNGWDGIRIATPYFSNYGIPAQQNNNTLILENIISGNRKAGITIESNTAGNQILDNLIGLASDGSPLGNGSDGVRIICDSYFVAIANFLSNQIEYNGGFGVYVEDLTSKRQAIKDTLTTNYIKHNKRGNIEIK